MYAEIATAIASLKTFGDLTSLVLKAKVDTAVTEKALESQAALISLNTAMLGLQAQHLALLAEKEQLEKQLIDIQNWEAEARKYTLTEISDGTFVYALKPDQGGPTPLHWLCPNCYQHRKKSILQRGHRDPLIGVRYECLDCNGTIYDAR